MSVKSKSIRTPRSKPLPAARISAGEPLLKRRAMKHSKGAREVLARIGATLIQIQRTELTINFCIKHVIPKTARPSKDMFVDAARRPPLGRLIAELHRHVAVSDSFKTTLEEFLDKRNALVHQIEFVPNWTL